MKSLLITIVLFFYLINSSCAQKDSLYKNYHKSGKISSMGIKINGLMQGSWKYYDDSLGYLKKVINYKNNMYHGIYEEFYQDGKTKKIGYYDRNFVKEEIIDGGYTTTRALRIGTWDYYDNKGGIIKTDIYDCNGNVINTLPEK